MTISEIPPPPAWLLIQSELTSRQDQWCLLQGGHRVQELHHVQPDVLHLHQVTEGDGLQGEPEEIPLARPQQVERSEGEEGKGTLESGTIPIFKFRLCYHSKCLLISLHAHDCFIKLGLQLNLLVIAMILTP